MKSRYFSVYELKLWARGALRGNLLVVLYSLVLPAILSAVLAAFIAYAAPGVRDTLSIVTHGHFDSAEEQLNAFYDAITVLGWIMLISNALLAFLTVGQKMTLIKAASSKKPDYKTLFSFFSTWFSALIAALIISAVGNAIGQAALMLPSYGEFADSLINLLVNIITLFLSLKFYFVFYIMAENGGKRPFYALLQSWRMTGIKTCANIIVLELSFIGWYLLAFCTMGITLIYSVPYQLLAQSELYKRVRKNYELQKLS